MPPSPLDIDPHALRDLHERQPRTALDLVENAVSFVLLSALRARDPLIDQRPNVGPAIASGPFCGPAEAIEQNRVGR
ncbi:MAG: hypothetical protein AAGF11_48555 [Myxococcota bacterium]